MDHKIAVLVKDPSRVFYVKDWTRGVVEKLEFRKIRA